MGTVEALYTAANYPSVRKHGKQEITLPDGTSALRYVHYLLGHNLVLYIQVEREGWANIFFSKVAKKGDAWQMNDTWQPEPLGVPMVVGMDSPRSIGNFLKKLFEYIDQQNPPRLPALPGA